MWVKRDDEVLAYLRASQEKLGRMPTRKETLADLGIKPTNLDRILDRLRTAGHIRILPTGTMPVQLIGDLK